MNQKSNKILIYAYGNPGRQDDGLGQELVSRLEKTDIYGIDIDYNYQLNIEDALTISNYEVVIFVDASQNADEPFKFYKIDPKNEIAFTTHAMSPEAVLSLCSELYKKLPEAYILAIRGYEWEISIGLTPEGADNCDKAFEFILTFLKESLSCVLKS
jgi:hydrogenase maturation protease